MARKKRKAKDLTEFAFEKPGEVDVMSVKECQSKWLYTNEVIPAYDEKLILATDKGTVLPGSFRHDTMTFWARLKGNQLTPLRPKAWRLYPIAPDKYISDQKEMSVIKNFSHDCTD